MSTLINFNAHNGNTISLGGKKKGRAYETRGGGVVPFFFLKRKKPKKKEREKSPPRARRLAEEHGLQRRAEPRPPVGPVPPARQGRHHPRVRQRDPGDGGPAREEQQAGHGPHPVHPREVGRLVKVVADVVLQEDDPGAAGPRLGRGVLPGGQGLLAGAAGAGVEGDGEDGRGRRRGEGVLCSFFFLVFFFEFLFFSFIYLCFIFLSPSLPLS